jgi:hypothetical protein
MTTIKTAPKATLCKLVSSTNNFVVNRDARRAIICELIAHAVKANVNDKTKAKDIGTIIQQALRADFAIAFKGQPYFKAGFNTSQKNAKAPFVTVDKAYPFGMRPDGTMVLDGTIQNWISRAKGRITTMGHAKWETAVAKGKLDLITAPCVGTKGKGSKAKSARVAIKAHAMSPIAGAFMQEYGPMLAARVAECAAGSKPGTFCTPATFNKRIKALRVALDTVLKAA